MAKKEKKVKVSYLLFSDKSSVACESLAVIETESQSKKKRNKSEYYFFSLRVINSE